MKIVILGAVILALFGALVGVAFYKAGKCMEGLNENISDRN